MNCSGCLMFFPTGYYSYFGNSIQISLQMIIYLYKGVCQLLLLGHALTTYILSLFWDHISFPPPHLPKYIFCGCNCSFLSEGRLTSNFGFVIWDICCQKNEVSVTPTVRLFALMDIIRRVGLTPINHNNGLLLGEIYLGENIF